MNTVINKNILPVTDITSTIFVMKRRKRDYEFVYSVGNRIKDAMGNMTCKELAEKVGVQPNTMWDYLNGVSLPNPKILSNISDAVSVSVDYLLKGHLSVYAKDALEQETLLTIREAVELGGLAVAEKIPEYGRFIIKEVKKPQTESAGQSKPARSKNGSR